MNLMTQVDGYCERTDPSFWSEPLNAVTNAAYLLVALWFLARGRGVPLGPLLGLILLAISVGSFLFHTLATGWAGLADTLPIGIFILVYLYALNRHVLGWSAALSGAGVALFLPYAAGVVAVTDALPFFRISTFYWAVPILMVVYGVALRHRAPGMARTLFLASALLAVSISVRSLDLLICEAWPIGTHFLWHLLNAAMFVVVLGGLRAELLAGARQGG